jgi:DNA-binding SARP family transcriptional activator
VDGLRVHLFGPFEVEGVDPHELGSRKARTLLKVLALARGQPVSVDHLADVLWGDDLPARPVDQLAVLVSRLRRVLGADRLVRSDLGYALRVDWLDLAELESRVDEAAGHLEAGRVAAARAVAQAALALVSGDLIADEYDPWWAEAERAAARRTVGRARLVGAEAALQAGDVLLAAGHAEAALDHDAYDEVALRLLMRAHVAAGRPGSALAAYARVRARLAEDLGTSPTPATEALHTAVVLEEHVEPDAPAPAAAVPVRLPGRDRDLAALDDELERAAATGVVLAIVEGEAGIGKTALLEAWAGAARARGVSVLWGACDPLGRALPYQPIGDALDAHLRALEPAAADDLLGDAATVLAPIIGRLPRGELDVPSLGDPARSQAIVFEALLDVVVRAGAGGATAVLLDDVQWADPSTVEWLQFAVRRGRGRPLLIVGTRRGEDDDARTLPGPMLTLGPLDLAATTEIVGGDRAAELLARSGGHPLFLTELAAAPAGDLPATIRDVVAERCEAAGPEAATTLRTASLLGPTVDIDLLAAVMGTSPAVLVDHLEIGLRRRLLDEAPAGFAFRHQLVREALAAGVSAGRRALVHREAAAALARRPGADPLAVAHHAHLGGDHEREAVALVQAADTAAGRFDYETAEDLLGRALDRREMVDARLLRARVRLMRRHFDEAQDDVGAALAGGAGAEAMEVAAWIAYYRRDLPAAVRLAADGARLADDPGTRSRCLTVLGRSQHSLGEIAAAEIHLREAVTLAGGSDSTVPSVWLGSLLVHIGTLDEATGLLRPATRPGTTTSLSLAPLYAHIYSAYAHACQGRPLEALAVLDPLLDEVRRRGVDRMLGIPDNFRGWILRNLGAASEADDMNEAALAAAAAEGTEAHVHADLDLLAGRLIAGDAAGARRRLDALDRSLLQLRTFVWRAELRRLYLVARLALLEEDWDLARGRAAELQERAEGLRAERYVVLGGLLEAEAGFRAGDGGDRDRIDQLLDRAPALAALESWWLAADLAGAADEPRWRRLAESRVATLAAAAGPYADALTRAAEARFGRLS